MRERRIAIVIVSIKSTDALIWRLNKILLVSMHRDADFHIRNSEPAVFAISNVSTQLPIASPQTQTQTPTTLGS